MVTWHELDARSWAQAAAAHGAEAGVRAMVQAVPSAVYTLPWNVSGHPALAVPAGYAEDGLPVSVQLIAPLKKQGLGDLFSLGADLHRRLAGPGSEGP